MMSVVKMELPSPFPRVEQKASLNPERIRCARETAGLSKVQLAESLGVTSRTVANYEEVGAPVSKAAVLADALQVMPSFFSVSPHAPLIEDLSEGQVWFRSLRKSTVRQRRSAVGHGRNALLFFRWIEDHFRLPECDLTFADSAGMRPDLAATMLRAILGYGENPLPEMTSLAEAHGIRLFSLPTVGREIDAFNFMFDGVPYIAVDTSKTAERVRFDIAHEIGHLMMHEMVSEDVAAAGTRDIEGEAHSFAANLLMPKRRVLGMVPTHASVSQIVAAKRYFKVSAMAMARRAYEMGRLSEWEYRQACSELTVQGYKSGEPRGLRPEQSKVFRFVADTNRQKGISVSTVSEETGLVPKELHGLSFGNIWAVTGGNVLCW